MNEISNLLMNGIIRTHQHLGRILGIVYVLTIPHGSVPDFRKLYDVNTSYFLF